MSLQIIDGDLTTCSADCIVQQCNCLSIIPYGLAMDIKQKLNIDPYGRRRRETKNCAVKEDRDQVGTTTIFRRKSGIPRYVACLFAQFAPGKPEIYFREITAGSDTEANRRRWFVKCLFDLSEQLQDLPDVKSVAFPYLIGCGLAGGDWKSYNDMILKWAGKHLHLQVYLVRK